MSSPMLGLLLDRLSELCAYTVRLNDLYGGV